MSSTLQDLVNRAVFYSTEVQTHFGGLIADAEWEVDFGREPRLTFKSADDVVLDARPHLLGSESSRDKSWLWGWENVNDFPDAVVGLSHDVRKFGAAEGVTELTTAELDLDDELPLRLTLAAKEATGKWAHYPAAAGAGTTVWLLVDAPEVTLPDPQVKVSVRALMQGLTQTTVTDHRAAVESYATKRGIPVRELPDGGLRMLFADGSADLSFDDERRISNCDMNTPLEGEAAEQFASAGQSPAEAAPRSTVAAPQVPAPSKTEAPTSTPEPAKPGSPSEAAVASGTPTEAAAPSAGNAGSASGADDDSIPASEGAGGRQEKPTPAAQAEPADAASSEDSTATHDGAETESVQDDAASKPSDRVEPAPTEDAPAADKDSKPKKKGLFSKLFGR